MEEKRLKGYPIAFNIYAMSEEEADECRRAIIGFIGVHAAQCRAVTARKVTRALQNWDKNMLVKNQIINYFK